MLPGHLPSLTPPTRSLSPPTHPHTLPTTPHLQVMQRAMSSGVEVLVAFSSDFDKAEALTRLAKENAGSVYCMVGVLHGGCTAWWVCCMVGVLHGGCTAPCGGMPAPHCHS